VAYRYCDVD